MTGHFFASFEAYETFLYRLPSTFASIQQSTVVLIRRGNAIATARGELHFKDHYRLVLREQLFFLTSIEIDAYGYEVRQDDELLYWYDSQPHPHIPELQATHPHHKHVPPDIKHNRVPAPGLSLTEPNLPFLIEEIERTLLTVNE